MSAETRVYARVVKTHEETIEVSAVTLDEAKTIAASMPGVVHVLHTTYDKDDRGL